MSVVAFKHSVNGGRYAIRVRNVGEAGFAFQNGEYLTFWHDGYAIALTSSYLPHPLTQGRKIALLVVSRL